MHSFSVVIGLAVMGICSVHMSEIITKPIKPSVAIGSPASHSFSIERLPHKMSSSVRLIQFCWLLSKYTQSTCTRRPQLYFPGLSVYSPRNRIVSQTFADIQCVRLFLTETSDTDQAEMLPTQRPGSPGTCSNEPCCFTPFCNPSFIHYPVAKKCRIKRLALTS